MKARSIAPFESFTIPVPFCGCLLWIGGAIDNRYGAYWDGDKLHRAHVYALEQRLGRKLQKNEFSCHNCDVTFCVNEDHLYVGTAQTNMTDKVIRGRQGNSGSPPKIPTEVVAYILSSDLSQQRLADMFGISQSHVGRLKRGIRSGRTGK